MSETNLPALVCPHCGNTLQLPEALAEFSCLYCGQRLTLDALLQTQAEESSQAKAILLEALPGLITGYPNTMKNLVPDKFPTYFEGFVAQHLPVLEMADSLTDADAADLARQTVDAVAAWLEKGRRGITASALHDEVKFTLCLLTVPALRQCAPRQGLALSQALHDSWVARFPKSNFQLTDYDRIAQGFRRKGLCFITTAVCQYLGKADDCRELQTLRAFRDGWLAAQPQGRDLIRAYYTVAPGIVTAIDLTGDADTVYPAIWQTYLLPCLEAIDRGDNAGCLALYCRMLDTLSLRYLGQKAA